MMTKRNLIWLAVPVCLLVCCASVFAQGTNIPPVTPSVPTFPAGKEAIWLALIAPITFTITWLIGKIPPLPKEILPWITPVVGIGIGFVMEKATHANWPWWSTAGAGAIATTLYEAAKGLSKAGPESPLTPTPQTTRTKN